MKKIVAIVAVFATVLSFSACKMTGNMTQEEREQYLSERQAEQEQSSLQAEQDYADGINKNVDKMGKTEKNKKLVVEVPSSLGKEYWVFVFNKKKVVDYKLIYQFFDLPRNYNDCKDFEGTEHKKVIKTDDEARMVVYKHTLVAENSFDELYDYFKLDNLVEDGYRIIE